ncbi:MAG: hypothetical protein DRO14_03235 [Thermoprotei archaeon]|nr:MAG: hypothetical protein DRO14_03235 [Thermoprotei archaeon]
MVSRNKPYKKEWSTIRIPKEVKNRIDDLRVRTGMVTWEIINNAVSFYEEFLRKPSVRTSTTNLDKLAWYITKLALAYGAFRENPCEEKYEMLVKRVEELKQRFGIEADILVRMADYYKSAKDPELQKKIAIDFSMAFKQVVKEIVIHFMFELVTKEQ